MEESWTLCSASLGVGFPLHKPYPYSLHRFEDSSILGTWKVWWQLGGPSHEVVNNNGDRKSPK